MTLLDICRNAARQVGVPVPDTVVGNVEETAASLLALARREGVVLARVHDWAVLRKEHVFATAAGTAAYDLPADFRSLLTATAWNRTAARPLWGPLTPAQWQARVSDLGAARPGCGAFRIRPDTGVRKFFLEPTPAAVATLAFEYLSGHWCRAAGGAAQDTWLADADEPLIDAGLVELGVTWRLLARLGLPYAEERAEYDTELMRARARDGGMATVALDRGRRSSAGAGDFGGTVPSWGNTPGLIWGYAD